MNNVLQFTKPSDRVISFTKGTYTLQVLKRGVEYNILENGKCIAVYGNMIKALNYFYKHKEANAWLTS